MIARGALGQKSGAGIYKRVGRDILVLDLEKQDYLPSGRKSMRTCWPFSSWKTRPKSSRSCGKARIRRPNSSGQFSAMSSIIALTHLGAIADNARDLDLAIRWGFAWHEGPFEIWQSAELAGDRHRDKGGYRCRQGHGGRTVALLGV